MSDLTPRDVVDEWIDMLLAGGPIDLDLTDRAVAKLDEEIALRKKKWPGLSAVELMRKT